MGAPRHAQLLDESVIERVLAEKMFDQPAWLKVSTFWHKDGRGELWLNLTGKDYWFPVTIPVFERFKYLAHTKDRGVGLRYLQKYIRQERGYNGKWPNRGYVEQNQLKGPGIAKEPGPNVAKLGAVSRRLMRLAMTHGPRGEDPGDKFFGMGAGFGAPPGSGGGGKRRRKPKFPGSPKPTPAAAAPAPTTPAAPRSKPRPAPAAAGDDAWQRLLRVIGGDKPGTAMTHDEQPWKPAVKPPAPPPKGVSAAPPKPAQHHWWDFITNLFRRKGLKEALMAGPTAMPPRVAAMPNIIAPKIGLDVESVDAIVRGLGEGKSLKAIADSLGISINHVTMAQNLMAFFGADVAIRERVLGAIDAVAEGSDLQETMTKFLGG